MVIVIGYPGYSLSTRLADLIGAKFVDVQDKVFPDGELYVKIINPDIVKRENVIIVSTLYPEQEKRLLKTLLMVDAVKNCEADKVILLIPYLAYSRQDKVFLPGEPISGCVVLKMMKTVGADALITIDIHSTRILECFNGLYLNVMVSDILVGHALRYLDNPVVIAPDKGALERASMAARTYGLDYDYLIKQRERVTGEISYTPRELNIVNRDIIIVDDIISTGSTIAEASKMLINRGARKIVVASTHGLLVGNALNKLESSGVSKVILADTLGLRYEHRLIDYVDIARKIVDSLEEFLIKTL